MTTQVAYACAKCGGMTCTSDEIRAAGKWGRFFDVQSKKFTAVTCDNCGYTELYRSKSGRAGNIMDFLSGG